MHLVYRYACQDAYYLLLYLKLSKRFSLSWGIVQRAKYLQETVINSNGFRTQVLDVDINELDIANHVL